MATSPRLKPISRIDSGAPCVATTMTPTSVISTPAICTSVVRVPYMKYAPASTTTGMEPCRMPMLMALV